MEWAIDHLGQLGTAAAALSTFAAAAWKLKAGARLERFGRWSWTEIRTTIWAKEELIEANRRTSIREATFATMEAENLALLRRVNRLLVLCGGSDSGRLIELPEETTISSSEPKSSSNEHETQAN